MATTKKKAKRGQSKRASATLRLDASFYPSSALKKAREAFAHLAEIEVKKQGKSQVVRFGKMSASAAKNLPDEFANYALSCTVVEG